jgi:hypothetical protein
MRNEIDFFNWIAYSSDLKLAENIVLSKNKIHSRAYLPATLADVYTDVH